MSGRGASDFGPLHIPFKKWGAAANLPHAHQFDQNMQRIEDWAERLRSGGGVGGRPVPVMDGRRFAISKSANDIVVEGVADGIALEAGPVTYNNRMNYSTLLSGTWDLEISAEAQGVDVAQKYLVEVWVQPTGWPEIVAPVSRQQVAWEVSPVIVSISYEWMIDWLDKAMDDADTFYGFTPPLSIRPELRPSFRVTLFDPPDEEVQLTVTGDVVLHQISLPDTSTAGEGNDVRPDLEQIRYFPGGGGAPIPESVPASTVAFSNAPPAVKGWVFEGSWSDAIVNEPSWSPDWETDPTGLLGGSFLNITSRTLSLQNEVSSDGPEVVLDDGKLVFNTGGEYRFTVTMHITLSLGAATIDTVVFSVQGSGLGVLGWSPEYFGEQHDTYEVVDTSTVVVSPGVSTIDWRRTFNQMTPEALLRAALTYLRLQIEKVS